MSQFLTSKKFWVTMLGLVGVVFSKYLGLDNDTISIIAQLVMAYVVGQGIADMGKNKGEQNGEAGRSETEDSPKT